MIGVLTGPSLVNCFNSPDGMGVCLRGELSEIGIGPAPADDTPAVATAPANEAAPAAGVEAETAIAEPELDVTPPEEGRDIPENLIAATFGLLRAEPDGSLVIAGSGTPGSEVEVYADDELLGSATVEPSGDWVLVPEAPIPPGGTEITLAETGKQGRAGQSFVVVIDPGKTEQPLVVASTPGEASEVLQGLERPDAGETIAVASAGTQAPLPETESESAGSLVSATKAPAAEPGTAREAAASEDVVEPAQVATASADEATEATAVATALSTEPAAPETTEPEAEATQLASTEAPASVPPVTETEPVAEPEAPMVVASAPEQSAPEPAPAVSTAASDVTAQPPASSEAEPAETAAPDTQMAAVDPQEPVEQTESTIPAEPAAVLADVPPTIDAIEIDGDRSFFAGAGPEGAIMRLYVDDVHIADAVVEAGRWLIEAGSILTGPQHRVRIDMLAPGAADVVARAEVNFVVELPEAEQSIAVASAPETEGQTATDADEAVAPPAPSADASAGEEPEDVTELAAAEAAEAAEPAETTQPAAPEAPEDTAVAAVTDAQAPAVEQPQPAQVAVASAPAEAGAAGTDQPAAEPDTTVVAQAPAVEDEPAAIPPEPAAITAPEPAAAIPEPAPAAEPETTIAQAPTDEEVPTMVAVPVGDAAEGQRFASGRAIIRRGDNLWTIARRVYGEGIKYTTIYEANADQIRDPDRIYPGQVFELPAEAL